MWKTFFSGFGDAENPYFSLTCGIYLYIICFSVFWHLMGQLSHNGTNVKIEENLIGIGGVWSWRWHFSPRTDRDPKFMVFVQEWVLPVEERYLQPEEEKAEKYYQLKGHYWVTPFLRFRYGIFGWFEKERRFQECISPWKIRCRQIFCDVCVRKPYGY